MFLCAVNNTNLLWVIDMLLLDNPLHRRILNSREIFQSEQVTSSSGVSRSVTVFGSLMVNNNTRICCQSLLDNNEINENCTILILYGRLIINFYATIIYEEILILIQVVLHHHNMYQCKGSNQILKQQLKYQLTFLGLQQIFLEWIIITQSSLIHIGLKPHSLTTSQNLKHLQVNVVYFLLMSQQ